MPFSWHDEIAKRPAKLLVRFKSLAISNPDFKVQHPNLVKELLNDQISNKIETKKKIKDICDKGCKYGKVPGPSVVIKRYNRVV